MRYILYNNLSTEYSKFINYESQEKAQKRFQIEEDQRNMTTKSNLHIDPFDKRQTLVIQENVLV